MLSCLLSSALQPPPVKSLKPISFRCLPTSKNRILMRGFGSKRQLGGRLRVSESEGMAELARAEVFGDGYGVEGGQLGEGDVARGNWTSGFTRDLAAGNIQSAVNRLSKWIVAVLFALVIIWKHDAEVMWAAMGSVLNSWLSISLKHILNHQRPVSGLRSDPGMPSSHAQALFYAAFFLVLTLVHWLGMNFFTGIVGAFILTSACYLAWLRISEQLHSANQVLVGGVLGSIFGISWFWLWHTYVLRAFIASIWVRLVVALGSVISCVVFIVYVVQHWLRDEP